MPFLDPVLKVRRHRRRRFNDGAGSEDAPKLARLLAAQRMRSNSAGLGRRARLADMRARDPLKDTAAAVRRLPGLFRGEGRACIEADVRQSDAQSLRFCQEKQLKLFPTASAA